MFRATKHCSDYVVYELVLSSHFIILNTNRWYFVPRYWFHASHHHSVVRCCLRVGFIKSFYYHPKYESMVFCSPILISCLTIIQLCDVVYELVLSSRFIIILNTNRWYFVPRYWFHASYHHSVVRCCLWVGFIKSFLDVPPLPDHRPATYWVQHTISCTAQSKAPEEGQNCCPKHVELNWIYQ